jgi:uncharacterized membrane protein
VSEDRLFEDYPLTRQEYIQVMVHFYRGEVARSVAWRERLDATTNWAVLTAAGMLSFAFAGTEQPHVVLLLGNVILLAYLSIEARRYRTFEVYRSRVRMMEENFLVPVLTRRLESPLHTWRDLVASDLDLPKYKTTFLEAFGFRLRRNYLFIFGIVLGGWLVKLALHPQLAASWRDVWTRMGVGNIHSGVVLALVGLFYVLLAGILWWSRHTSSGEPFDEIEGLQRWQTSSLARERPQPPGSSP